MRFYPSSRRLVICLLLALVALPVLAAGSFRLDSGKILSTGMSKAEVMALAGAPLSIDTETIGVDKGQDGDITPVTRETLSYILHGSIGGDYLVEVKFENGTAISIRSKQHNRI